MKDQKKRKETRRCLTVGRTGGRIEGRRGSCSCTTGRIGRTGWTRNTSRSIDRGETEREGETCIRVIWLDRWNCAVRVSRLGMLASRGANWVGRVDWAIEDRNDEATRMAKRSDGRAMSNELASIHWLRNEWKARRRPRHCVASSRRSVVFDSRESVEAWWRVDCSRACSNQRHRVR